MSPHLPPDEYDSYIPEVCELLAQGVTIHALAAHLKRIEVKKIGVSTGESHRLEVAQRLHALSGGPLGLIAGAGRFPFLVAGGARQMGRPVVIVGLRGLTDPAIRALADRFYWSGVVRLGRWIRVFRRHGVHEAIM